MSTKDNGGPAFPIQDGQAIHAYAAAAVVDIPANAPGERDDAYIRARAAAVGGMTLRDYFAAKAMEGIFSMIAAGAHSTETDIERGIARQAYQMADAMLLERSK